MQSFSNKKQLRFEITLGTSKFNEKGDNQIILQGYRSEADIEIAGGLQMGNLRARIYGMSESDMYSATMYPLNIGAFTQNTIIVYAVDGDTESIVFAGNVFRSWANYSNPPDIYFEIQAQAAISSALKAVRPRSFKGVADVAQVMSGIAEDMGYVFENNGTVVKLADIYLANTSLEQAKQLAKDAGINFVLDGKILAITPVGVARNSNVPKISTDNGMMGYPSYDGTYVTFQTKFNAQIIPNGLIELETSYLPAAGKWAVLSLQHTLEAEKPDGVWMTSVVCTDKSLVGRLQ
jgi:hypothetical protein